MAGETITGVSTWNQATQHAINRMTANGITGFIDHGGHHWSAEAYVAMDIRTTVFNTGRAAVWETNQNFGNDLYQVSYHNGARPLCYPWQNKVISSTDNARTVVDLDGNEIHVYAQSETSFGEAAGLFGVNCKHYPNPFIPGVSVIRGEPQDEEANAKTYAESQEQRRLERTLREEKRDLMMLKAQGAPEEMIAAQQERVRQRSADIQDFCDSTGRARHRDREGVYTKREFPAADTYDVAAFTREQQNLYNKYWKSGGAQVDYNNVSGMVPNMAVPATPQNVAQQATQTPNVGVQSNPGVMSVRDFAEYKRYMKDTHGIEVTAGVGRLDFDMVKEATSGFESVAKDFPEVTKNVKKVRLSKSGVMSCNGEEITFNSDYFTDRTVMDDAIDRCTRTNWWRKGATVSSIGAHETAHAVEAVLIEKSGKYQSQFAKVNAWNNGTEARDIVKEACDELLKLPQNSGKSAFELIKDQISGYGAKGGNSETMAEAFADVNAVGANATPLAQAIVRITQKKYNQYLGVIP